MIPIHWMKCPKNISFAYIILFYFNKCWSVLVFFWGNHVLCYLLYVIHSLVCRFTQMCTSSNVFFPTFWRCIYIYAPESLLQILKFKHHNIELYELILALSKQEMPWIWYINTSPVYYSWSLSRKRGSNKIHSWRRPQYNLNIHVSLLKYHW